ncbi:MAG: hypothetical protein IPJ65_27785 [Archangiaceae bacterium]|nr:hypothetical protein [Archangiaceae bacterium]
MGGDEVPCHLEIDGKKVGDTPYLSPLLRQGEHLLHAVCLGWPAEELIWPFPSPDRQKLGMLVEIPVGTLADTETREANRPMQDESLSSNSGTSCPKGKPCAPPKH